MSLIQILADKLLAEGICPSDRIGVCCESRLELYLLTLACWKIGAVIVPVSTRYTDQKRAFALQSANCKAVFVSRSLKSPFCGCRCRILEDIIDCPRYETAAFAFDQFQFDLAAPASIIFTSGSSGRPKGVLHTLGSHYYNALGAHQLIPFGRGDRWLVSLPMYHIGGFALMMRSLIAAGTLVFIRPDESLAEAVIHQNITHLSLVPVQLSRLMQNPQALESLKRCRSILLGGSAFSPVLIQNALKQGLALSTTYGLTEAASQAATIRPADLKHKPDSSGQVLAYRELNIAEDGEICIKGPALFQGYIVKDGLHRPFDREGFFHTGDIGRLDDQGFLFVTGRKDRMFISGGENIYPEEIERVLLALESVEQVYVVPVPDAVMGQRPAAFIRTAPGLPVPDAEAVRLKLQAVIERFKIPSLIFPWPESMPETAKPDGRVLQQIALEKKTEKGAL